MRRVDSPPPVVQPQPAVERIWHPEVDRLAEHQRQKRYMRRPRAAAPGAVVPRHVQQCGKAGLYLWRTDGTGGLTRAVYRCGSFRCPVCRGHESHVLFSRVQQAFDGLAADMTFWVFTFAQRGKALDVNAAYSAIRHCSNRFLKRLRRFALWMGWDPIGKSYAQTVEAHASGWPHVNMLLAHSQLREYIAGWQHERDREALCGACRDCDYCRETLLLPPALRAMAEESGFGSQCSCDVPRSAEAAIGYATKVAGKHEQTLGEVAKATQLPMMAPQRFRRIRSGKGFLPSRNKGDGTYTGTIAMRRRDPDGSQRVIIPRTAMAGLSPETTAKCELARELELQLCDLEDMRQARTGRQLHWPLTMVHVGDGFVFEAGGQQVLAVLSQQQAAAL